MFSKDDLTDQNSAAEKLINCVSLGQISAVRELISKGVDVNAADKFGNCAIIEAACLNNIDMVRVLIQEGHANVAVRDNFENTPSTWAKKNDNMPMINLINSSLKHSTTTTAKKR